MRLARWNDVIVIEKRKVADLVDRQQIFQILIFRVATILNTRIHSQNVHRADFLTSL